jgi:Glycosyltransferase family 87
VRRLGLERWRLAPIVLAPALLGPVFLNRYDPVPALLVALTLIALLRGRGRVTGALLGVAAAVKVYPLVYVLPALRRVRSPLAAAVAFVIAAGVLTLPFVALGPGGVRFSFKTQLERHLQIESLGSSILLVLSKLGIHHVDWINGAPGSIDLGGGLATGVGAASAVFSVLLVVLVAWVYFRGPDDDARLVTAFAAAGAAFTVFGKVLSPQYLTWLLPLAPLAAGRKGRYAAISFLTALALTQPEYIVDKWGLRHQNWTVWALLLRNAALVATFVLLLAALRERRAT